MVKISFRKHNGEKSSFVAKKKAGGTDLAVEVKEANKLYFNRIPVNAYNASKSLFSEARQEKINAFLKGIVAGGKNEMLLDLGCGTGNILRIASSLFRMSIGIDIATDLLARIKQENKPFLLVGADGEKLPFRDRTFDCVSAYAVLHHLIEPNVLLREAYRVLKRGGYIYIDHDLNWYCARFVLPFKRMLSRRVQRDCRLAEYHLCLTNGLKPFVLKRNLEDLGFGEIKLTFRHSDNVGFNLPQKIAHSMLKFLSKIFQGPSFFTHFCIIAKK